MPQWFASILERIMDFSNILNASIAASWMVLAVIILRFLLKNSPKWSHVALWGLVALRLLLPFSIESNLSLIPSTETVPQEILRYQGTQLQTPAYLDVVSNPNFPGSVSIPAGHSVDYVQWQMVDMTFIWLAGIAALLLYTAVSYLSLRRKLATAVILRENIFFQSENAGSPFVLGIIKPRIYLPYHMDQETLHHVIAHEQAHILRRDHWWKPLGFLLLTIHWFNPVMWLAYVLLCRDIELACDEKVIKEMGSAQRADYTQALVSCSVNHRHIAACPLAFGEVGVKERVKSVMNYRKPAFWVIVLSIVACTVVAVCFLTDPQKLTIYDIFDQNGYSVINQEEVDITLYVEKSKLPDSIYTAEGHTFEPNEVLAYSTETSRIYLHKAMISNESDELLYLIFDCAYDLPESGSFVSPYQYTEENDSTQSTLHLRSKNLRDGSTTYPDALDMRGHGPGSQFAFYVSKEACMAAEGTLMIDVTCNQIEYAKSGHGYDSQQASSSQVRNPWVQEYIPGAEGIIGNVDKEKFESISEDFAIGADQYGHAVFKDPHKAFDTFVVLFADGIALIQEQNDLSPISKSNYSAYKKFGWQVDYGLVETQKQAAFVTSFLDIYENSFATEVPSASTEIPSTAPTAPVTKWFDYLNSSEEMPSAGPLEITLPELPDVTFRWYPKRMEAVANGKTHTLYSGSPILSAYFCDFTGDGLPELCSTVSIDSDEKHNIILVYDYANRKGYDLEERGVHDFSLRLSEDGGHLYADQRVHPRGESVMSGLLVFKDDSLQILKEITANYYITDITDPTKKKGFSYDTATEKFFEDETYDYLFRGIYSQYVIVQYADGTTEDIVTALNSGKASIADLDRFGIHYLAEPRADSLDAAIRTAILEHNRYFNTLFHCASFVPLQQVELSFDSDPPQPNQVTVYGMALHYAFRPFGSGFRRTSGSHGPVAITFEVENGKYSLMEYWEAGKGENYVSSVRNKFPDEIEDAALDTTKFIDAQMQDCYAQAAAFWNSDTTAAIEELFTIIESSPLQSSNPGDYINEHPLEYRELTYYGQFTLRYCFEQFLKGGQIGLRGHLMRAVIDDIAPESKLQIQTMTGQEYFDEWKAAAFQLSEQHSTEWIKGNQPAVYILLQMMGES